MQNFLVIFTLCEVIGHNGQVNGLQDEHTAGQLLFSFPSWQDPLQQSKLRLKAETNLKAQWEYILMTIE